ncbi:MAG TPA: DMT family transporter [Candidatus Acidoferrales bacterium]|nr:DMT family transporter [Candidatus Acidoferrales bacterium]
MSRRLPMTGDEQIGHLTRRSSRSPHTKAWVQMHLCVFLWGFTAILGKLITLAALPLVWWRMLLVSAALLLVPRVRRGVGRLSPRQRLIYAVIGTVLSLHWLAFYGAIKLSNASVAATCMALGPVFMAFIEPVIVGRAFERRELVFGAAAVPGVAMVVGGTPESMHLGLLAGVAAAALVAVFGSLNKRFIEHADALTVTFLEMGAGVACLTVVAALLPNAAIRLPDMHDAVLLLVLAGFCTLLPFALSLVALRELSAFDSALAVNLEPLYAVVMAIPLFGEQRDLGIQFYAGGAIILAVVLAHPWIGRGVRDLR